MRRRSGIAVDPIPLMIHLIGEHGAQDGMAEMIVAFIARKVGEQVLHSVIDVFLCRDALGIAVLWLSPYFSAPFLAASAAANTALGGSM